jgi:hypothetical protein
MWNPIGLEAMKRWAFEKEMLPAFATLAKNEPENQKN